MDESQKETLMASVISGTIKNVKSKFSQYKPFILDDSFFDYELLKAAINRKHHNIIYFLIKLGCRVRNPNKVNSEDTPLHLAVKYGNNNIIQKILLDGAGIYDKNENGETAIQAGFKQKNHHDAVKTIFKILDLKYSFIQVISPADYEEDPMNVDNINHFHIACIMNHLDIVKHYLNFGFDVNGMFNLDSAELSSLNPLLYAATKKYYTLYEGLLRHGADLSIKNDSGLTTLHIFYYNSCIGKEIIEKIFNYGNETKYINSVDNNGVSHFHLSCMTNYKNVKVFIDKGVDVNSTISMSCSSHPGFTPLHFAVKYGHGKIVQLLLEHGADCNKADKESNTPLHLACEQNCDTSVIEMLLNYNACASAINEDKSTPLHMAFYNSSYNLDFYETNTVEKLISTIPRQVNFTDSHGLSVFHIICTGGNKSQVEDYLKSGVAVNSRVESGHFRDYTALHFAVLYNRIEIVELLLNCNAQVNFNSDQAPSPLHLACECNFVKFKEIYNQYNNAKSNNESVTVDWTLNRKNQINIIKLLLLRGAEVENKEFENITALLNCCKVSGVFPSYHSLHISLKDEICFRTKEIIEILLSNNANINAQTYRKESILHIIGRKSYLRQSEEFVTFLITKGANINATDHRRYTPLHNAVISEDWKLVKIYLKHKANVNAKTKDFLTPLELLYNNFNEHRSNHKYILCALLESGSDVNIRLKNGKMIVLDAIESCKSFVIKMLLQYGADIIAKEFQDNWLVSYLFRCDNEFHRFAWAHSTILIETFQIVFIHVQKLMALGYAKEQLGQCSIKLLKLYNRVKETDNSKELVNVYSDCVEELEKMKLVKIDNYTSLHSILIKDAHELSKHVKNETLLQILHDPNIDGNFPLYSYLLKIQYRKGLVRSNTLQSADTALSSAIRLNLPDLCCDSILQYLTNEEIVHLKIAARTGCKKKLTNDSSKLEIPAKFQKKERILRNRRYLLNK